MPVLIYLWLSALNFTNFIFFYRFEYEIVTPNPLNICLLSLSNTHKELCNGQRTGEEGMEEERGRRKNGSRYQIELMRVE